MAKSNALGAGEVLFGALGRLATTIDARASADASESYTAKLLSLGPLEAGKKFGEEAVEFAIAVSAQHEADITAEAADVLYHMWVALKSRGISLEDVGEALAAREGRSGLDEKAGRGGG